MYSSSIEVLCVSAQEQDWDFKSESRDPSRLRVHGRVRVLDNAGVFDVVRVRLHGAVRVKIGSKVDLEMLHPTTMAKQYHDFKPSYSTQRSIVEEQTLDFVLPVPVTTSSSAPSKSSDDHSSPNFLPSMALSGSTYVTRVTALKDRHLVQGSCQVVYWLEADLVQSRSDEIVRKLCCPVDLTSLHTPLKVTVADKSSTDAVEQIIKPKTSSWTFGLTSQTQPQISIRMPSQLGTISSLTTSGRQLSIPVQIVLKRPRTGQHVESIKCLVKANWYTSRTFATGAISDDPAASYSNSESVIQNKTVSTQTINMTLPPLYHPHSSPNDIPNSSNSNSKATQDSTCATTINLLLPDSVSSPSVSTNLLRISYLLDLSIRLEFDQRTSDLRPCEARFSLPVILSAAQPTSMHVSNNIGSLSTLVERGLMNAPPPYVY